MPLWRIRGQLDRQNPMHMLHRWKHVYETFSIPFSNMLNNLMQLQCTYNYKQLKVIGTNVRNMRVKSSSIVSNKWMGVFLFVKHVENILLFGSWLSLPSEHEFQLEVIVCCVYKHESLSIHEKILRNSCDQLSNDWKYLWFYGNTWRKNEHASFVESKMPSQQIYSSLRGCRWLSGISCWIWPNISSFQTGIRQKN